MAYSLPQFLSQTGKFLWNAEIKTLGCESTHFTSWEQSGYSDFLKFSKYNVLNWLEEMNKCPHNSILSAENQENLV